MNQVASAVRTTGGVRNLTLRRWAFGLLVALLAQFGIGMWVNLFTNIPLSHPGRQLLSDGAALRGRSTLLRRDPGPARWRKPALVILPGGRIWS